MQLDATSADPIVFQVVCVGAGGSLWAIFGLWVGNRWGRRYRRRIAGGAIGAFLLIAGILGAATQSLAMAWPVAALSGASLVAWTADTLALRRGTMRKIAPALVWVGMLAASLLFCLAYTLQANTPSDFSLNVPQFKKSTEAATRALTDQGRELDLFHYDPVESAETTEAVLLDIDYLKNHVIRLEGPDCDCNCHGWVFSGGKYGVRGTDVDTILGDNGYAEGAPASGDVIVYRDVNGVVVHTGVVRLVGSDGLILIESKWGPLGVYLHTPEAQPYGLHYSYYHSARSGHLLKFEPQQGGP